MSTANLEFTMGELAERAEVHIENIRYYERIGLIPESARTAKGHRRFGQEHLRRLVFVRRARGMGFSQDEVRTLLALSNALPGSCDEVRGLASAHLKEVRAKIADLRELEKLLSDAVAKCASRQQEGCPIIEALGKTCDCGQVKSGCGCGCRK